MSSPRRCPSVSASRGGFILSRVLFCCALALLAGLVAPQGKQKPPKPGEVERWSLGEVRGQRTYLRGYTPTTPRPRGGHRLLVLLPDREQSAKKLLASWPLEVFSRKGFAVAVPELRKGDYTDVNANDLQAVVQATLVKARELWSIDPRKVFILGIGSGAPGAIVCGGGESSAFIGSAAVLPDSLWKSGELNIDPAGPPSLVLTGRGARLQPAGAALVTALLEAGRPVRRTHDRELQLENVTEHAQRLLEWFLDRAREKERAAAREREEEEGEEKKEPETEIPDIRGRTNAASGTREQIIVIPGEYDEVEKVLEQLQIPHLVLSWKEFAEHDLAMAKVILINCSIGDQYQKARSKAIKNLKDYVEAGGYVFTTDWAIRYPLAETFGGQIGWIEPFNESEMLPVRPAPGAGNHPLLQNVFPYDHPDPQWQLDPASWLMDIRKPKETTVLLTSPTMGMNHENDVVGALFHLGKRGGCALNVVSHFSHQGEGGASTPMYQLIVNFINEAKFGVRKKK